MTTEKMLTRHRVGFGGKLILQVLVEEENPTYFQLDPPPGTKPTYMVWRDATVEDISVKEME